MSATQVDIRCQHCGDPCPEGDTFCCAGCRTVHDLLHEAGMGGYYDLEATPGLSQKVSVVSDLAYLDDSAMQARLVDYMDAEHTHITFTVPGIHCSSCIWLLEHLPRLNAGIVSSRVDFPNRTVSVRFRQAEVSLAETVRLLRKIGYEPVLSLASERRDEPDAKAARRRRWLKLGLAGFAFGNVMLFSLPEYFAPELLDETLKAVFTVLNIALSLPVLLYSASDYLTGAWRSVRQRMVTLDVPIALGIIALYAQSLADVALGTGPGYFDSFTGLIFFLLIGKTVQGHTYDALSFNRTYEAYFPLAVHRLERDELTSVAVGNIRTGDPLFIRNQELVPCDCVLESERCQIDYRFVTGESELVTCLRGDIVYAGGRVAGAAAVMAASKPANQSYLTRLWNQDHPVAASRNAALSVADRISPTFTTAVMIIAFTASGYWALTDWSKAGMVLASVLIIACPCALAMAAPFTLAAVRRHLGRHQFFTKNTLVVETFAKIRTILFDKTGTLTDAASAVEFVGVPLTGTERQDLSAALRNSTHPLGRRVTEWLNVRVDVPADTFLEEKGMGVRAWVRGRDILAGSAEWLASSHVLGLPAELPGSSSVVYVAMDGRYRGRVEIRNQVRPGLDAMLSRLHADGYALHVVSGDSSTEENRRMAALPGLDSVRFRQSPEDKHNAVDALKAAGPVMMVGDGLNDGAALRTADAGVAVADDIHAFTPASDAIIRGDALSRLPDFLGFSRAGMRVIYTAYGLSFAYNVVGLSFAVQGLLTPIVSAILMPLSSLTIIAFTTGAVWLTGKTKGL
jgi:Cu+-exporting ATPase